MAAVVLHFAELMEPREPWVEFEAWVVAAELKTAVLPLLQDSNTSWQAWVARKLERVHRLNSPIGQD